MLEFVQFRQRRSQLTDLFCFPFAGGGANFFRDWQDKFADKVNVFALLMPGREKLLHATPMSDYTVLIQSIYRAFSQYKSKNYFLFGYSLGSLLAYDLSQYVAHQKGVLANKLYLAAMSAPHRIQPAFFYDDLDDDALLNFLQTDKDSAIARNAELAAIFHLLLPTLRADRKLYENYQCSALTPLPIAMTTFSGSEDKEHDAEKVAGWQSLTSTSYNNYTYTGAHMFINRHKDEIIKIMSDDILRMTEQ